nr:9496_t:CDS:2 [Entrophospora candida]
MPDVQYEIRLRNHDVIERPREIHGFKDKSLENFPISPCGQYIAFVGNNGYIILIVYQYFTDQFHLPSLNAFPNWPTFPTPLSFVQYFDFSPASGYLTVATIKINII